MDCPYLVQSCTKATIIKYNQDNLEEGSIVSDFFQYKKCSKEECGAWYKGKCRYRKGKNNE